MTDTSMPSVSLRNPLAETLRAGRLGLTMIVQQMQSVNIALAARHCGFDALSVDLEHSVIPESAAAQICVAAQWAGVTPLVRLPSLDAHYANRMLDAGALGVLAPHVGSAEEARAVVRACKFAPQGERSVAGSWPHLGYQSLPAEQVGPLFNAATMVIVMLETPQAIEQADEIAAVPGVDILHIGSVDLCEALGLPGRFEDAALARCFDRLIAACRKHGKVSGAGGLGGKPELMQRLIHKGLRFATAGIEWDFMLAGAHQRAGSLRALTLKAS